MNSNIAALMLSLVLSACGKPTDASQANKVEPRTQVLTEGSATEALTTESAACCAEEPAAPTAETSTQMTLLERPLEVPDVELINQDGQSVSLKSDVIQGRTVIFSFLFTTCMGVCPPIGANFARLERLAQEQLSGDYSFVTITVDPATDRPQRLLSWRKDLGGSTSWQLLTGSKQTVDRVLKELGVFAADKNDHTPFLLIGDQENGTWHRMHGLTAPEDVLKALRKLPKVTQGPSSTQSANYFGNSLLMDQAGREHAFYSDLMADHVVVIHPFFMRCTNTCPMMLATTKRIQEWLGNRLGKEAHLLSISVDPEHDTPERVAALAKDLGAQPGWHLLTGDPTQVAEVLSKLGLQSDTPETHQNVFLIGNDRTGLWKKAQALAPAEEVIQVIESVLNDEL